MKRPSATEEAGAVGTAALRGYFASLARYHAWATAKLYEHVDRLDDADYRKDAGLFFKSVHGTLNHLLVAEHASGSRASPRASRTRSRSTPSSRATAPRCASACSPRCRAGRR